MKSQLSATRLTSFFSSSALDSSVRIASQDYLIGLRGILVIQAYLFVFFQLFMPTAVADSKNTDGPLYQIVLRKSLSILFWNESLIYSFIIFLSARTICLPFLNNTSRAICSSSIFRRGIRLWIPTFIIYSLSAAAFSAVDTQYIADFLAVTKNVSIMTPLRLRNFLVYFNSLFEVFWLTKWYGAQAANQAFPSGTLWIVSLLFQQSYTVYMTMIIVPYTRTSWRVKALIIFILTAWWVQSWAWYSVTGLLIADAVLNMNFQSKSRNGFTIGKIGIPVWPLYATMVFAGVLLQFLFIAWRPDLRNAELQGHTGLYTTGTLNQNVNPDEPQARDDNYLIILGLMLLIETFDRPQKFLRGKVLLALGRRSFSVFLVKPLILYTVGIKLFMHVYTATANREAATAACFFVCLPLIALTSEVFYRFIDLPSVAIAKEAWSWLKN